MGSDIPGMVSSGEFRRTLSLRLGATSPRRQDSVPAIPEADRQTLSVPQPPALATPFASGLRGVLAKLRGLFSRKKDD
jgi:hypothetical protein